MKLRREYEVDGETVAVTAERIEGDRWRIRVGDRALELRALPLGDGGLRLIADGDDGTRSHIAFGADAGQPSATRQYMVRINGRTHTLQAPAARGSGAGGGGDGTIRAPMTGTVLAVHCKVGDQVEADATLVVLSAMKMEHKLAAGVAGVVTKVEVADGATVDQGAELVVVEADADAEAETP